MRKMISFICVLVVCMMLVGCRKEHISDEAYNGAMRAIETIEAYQKFDITMEECVQRLKSIGNRLEYSDDLGNSTVGLRINVEASSIKFGHDPQESIDSIRGVVEY